MTRDEQRAAIERMFADPLTAEICPECGGTISHREVIGNCLYLFPCGDRAGQITPQGRLTAATITPVEDGDVRELAALVATGGQRPPPT